MENADKGGERPANFQKKLEFFKTVIQDPDAIVPWDRVRPELEDMSLGEQYSSILEIRNSIYPDWTDEDFADLLAELDEFKGSIPQKSISQETLEWVEQRERENSERGDF